MAYIYPVSTFQIKVHIVYFKVNFGLPLSSVYECLCFWQLTKGMLKIYSIHSWLCGALGLSPHNFALCASAIEKIPHWAAPGRAVSCGEDSLPWYCFSFPCGEFALCPHLAKATLGEPKVLPRVKHMGTGQYWPQRASHPAQQCCFYAH